jgi:hypothetical protein
MRLLISSLFLGLAWFAAVNAAVSIVAWAAARLAGYGRVPLGPGRLLFLRLLPASLAAMFVAAVFLPAHMTLEPADSEESFGGLLFALTAFGVALLGRSLFRVFEVVASSMRIGRAIRHSVRLMPSRECVHVLPGYVGVSLAGVFRSRVIVGSEVRDVLTSEELALAVAHEDAHRMSRDNLKRCLMFCAPDFLGFSSTARELERQWRIHAECLADARVVAGDEDRAAHLASALLKVARLAVAPRNRLTSPVWSTFHEPALLETRILRLVSGTVPSSPRRRFTTLAALAIFTASTLLVSNAGIAHHVHSTTETLISLLP